MGMDRVHDIGPTKLTWNRPARTGWTRGWWKIMILPMDSGVLRDCREYGANPTGCRRRHVKQIENARNRGERRRVSVICATVDDDDDSFNPNETVRIVDKLNKSNVKHGKDNPNTNCRCQRGKVTIETTLNAGFGWKCARKYRTLKRATSKQFAEQLRKKKGRCAGLL